MNEQALNQLLNNLSNEYNEIIKMLTNRCAQLSIRLNEEIAIRNSLQEQLKKLSEETQASEKGE